MSIFFLCCDDMHIAKQIIGRKALGGEHKLYERNLILHTLRSDIWCSVPTMIHPNHSGGIQVRWMFPTNHACPWGRVGASWLVCTSSSCSPLEKRRSNSWQGVSSFAMRCSRLRMHSYQLGMKQHHNSHRYQYHSRLSLFEKVQCNHLYLLTFTLQMCIPQKHQNMHATKNMAQQM